MPVTIHAFPNLSHPVRSLMLNEGNVHSSLVVSMRRKCKAEACVQNICSWEFYLNEARVQRAPSNTYLLKVTMEPDVLQARGGLCFVWSDLLHVPTHVLSPRLSKPTLCLCGQSKRGVRGLCLLCLQSERHELCTWSQVLQVQCIFTHLSMQWLLTAPKKGPPCIFIMDEQLFDLQLYWIILMTLYVDHRTGKDAKALFNFFFL